VQPIPVTIVTGFLGAGKSTLVEAWLTELSRERTAVIVNEAGEVGIDGALLSAHVSRVREITGGCVCCATQAELARALSELSDEMPTPTRILVETSGDASPAGVIRAMTRGRAKARLRLDGVVTVVDATRIERALAFDLAVEQLGFADVVVLSHIDRCADVDLTTVQSRVESYAPGAVVVHARNGRVEGERKTGSSALEAILNEREGVLRLLPVAARSETHRPIDAVSLSVDGPLDEDRFGAWVEEALGSVEARILRVKGILAMTGVPNRVILQGVGEAIEVSLGAPWGDASRTSRLVVLGLGMDADALERGFAACAETIP